MGIRKEDNADLERSYSLNIEIGLVLALMLLILAFRVDIRRKSEFQIVMEQQEIVQIEEITQTEQQMKPPPPPRPPVPVEVPNDEIVEEEPVRFDASLDLRETLDVAPTPPPVPEAEEEKEEPEIFVVVEERPRLIGGLAALQKAVKYPEFAKKAGIEGTVFVQFVVDEKGNVENPQVTRSVHKLLDEAALEAIRKMKFTPGKQRGRPVKVQMSLPVRFILH